MKNKEKTLASKAIFNGKVIQLHVDTVDVGQGRTATREIARHPGAAAIVALTDRQEVIMVTQYRKAIEQELLEIPAGKLDDGEDPLTCAKRELVEETGYSARRWVKLLSFYTSPGFCNEEITIYLARGLERLSEEPEDQDEISSVQLFPLDDLLRSALHQEIKDAKTIAGIYAANAYLAE